MIFTTCYTDHELKDKNQFSDEIYEEDKLFVFKKNQFWSTGVLARAIPHVAKLMRKVGVQNRIALSVHAITHSLVTAK